jgi:hypothetical protein
VTESQILLRTIAPQFGYDPTDVANYNNRFRNVVYAFLSPERLSILYSNGGLSAVSREVSKLKVLRIN